MRNVIAISFFLAVTTGVSATATPQVSGNRDTSPVLVGGDLDVRGCKWSAGYSWDAENATCGRVWEKEAQFGKPMASKTKRFHWQGDRFEVSVRYPKTGVSALDKAVVAHLRSSIVGFKSDVAEMPAKDEWDGSYEMFADFEKSSYRGFASVTVSDYRFTGGAHGNTGYENFNADLKTGKILSDADLFKDPVAAKKKIAELVYEKLVKDSSDRIYSDKFEVKAALSETGALDILRFTKGGLEFQSTPYQVGPYASGVVKVSIPYAGIVDLFKGDVAERLK